MIQGDLQNHSWKTAVGSFLHPRVVTMLFLGFSAGIPILLIFSSLSLWLREAGVERSTVTFFSWAALGYSFKFVWAPLVDKLPLPVLTRAIGRRRSWMLFAQCMVIVSIACMALIDPCKGNNALTVMAAAAVMLGFSSATQDIVIDAYRIESAGEELQAMMASTYIAGYRIAMILAGAGALFLADFFGSQKGAYSYQSWQMTYFIMASSMAVGIVTTLVIPEPDHTPSRGDAHNTEEYVRFLLLFAVCVTGFVMSFFYSAGIAGNLKEAFGHVLGNTILAGVLAEALRLVWGCAVSLFIAEISIRLGLAERDMVEQTYVEPVRNFFSRYGTGLAVLLLSLVGLYRISDIVLGVISNVFYQDLGFTKKEIAAVSKVFGVVMTLAGGFIGGILSVRYGVIRILFLGGVLAAATNLLFMMLAETGADITMLYVVISADSLAGGLASAAFVAFLSSLTDIKFTAMQYAIFSSLMTLIPKVTGGYSGTIVDTLGYPSFFLITALMGIPVLLLVWLAGRFLALKEPQ